MQSEPMINLEHVGIAVDDASSSLAMIADVLQKSHYKSETLKTDAVRTYFLPAGPAKLELLEPLSADSPIAKFLRKRGPGLHHLAFEVDDIHRTYDRLVEAGVRVIDDAPRPGADGKLIFFVHPEDTGGVLFEFCQANRSILIDIEIGDTDRRFRLRHAGRALHPPTLVVNDAFENIEMLAARLEQSAYVLATSEETPLDGSALLDAAGIDRVHLVASTRHFRHLNLPPERLRSTILVVNDEEDGLPGHKNRLENMLIAASPTHAPAAARLWSNATDAGIVVAEENLLARAIQAHIERIEGLGVS